MTGFSIDKDGKQTGGLEQWATSLGKMVGSVKGLWQQLETGKKKFDAMNAVAGKSKSSFSDYIKYISESEDATEAFGIATLYTRARVLLLNMALSTGLTLAASLIVKKITEASQSIETNATKSKEAADAAQSTTSSLKDLVSAYKELGDKSGWDTDDFDQAKDIQDQLLDLAKEQNSLDQDRVEALNLQNGKYEDQLDLLDKLTMKQLEAASYDLTTSKDAQGEKLVQTGKTQNRSHLLTILNNDEMSMADNIRDSGIDIENSLGGFGADNWKDPDSVVDYYNNIGDALKYVIDNTTEAERKAGGAYHNLYQFLIDEQNALKDDVENYNDSTDAIKDNANARAKLAAVILMEGQKDSTTGGYSDYEKINSALETLKSTIDGFDSTKLNDLLWGNNEGLTNEQVDALTVLRKAITDMDFSADTDGVNAFIQALIQLGMVSLNATDGLTGLQQAAQDMEEISKEIDNLQSAYKACSTAMEEYNQYGYMSADSLQSLLSMDTQYLSCLDLVDGKLQINKQRYAELLAAQYAQAEVTAIQQATEELKAIQDEATKEKVEGLTTATEEQQTAMENAIPAIKDTTVATGDLAVALATAQGAAGDDEALNERINAVTTALNTKLAAIHANTQAAINSGTALANQLNGFPNAKKKNRENAKSVTDVASAFDTLTKAMKEYNQYGYICADTMKSLVGVDDKFTACLTEQNGKLKINTATFRTFIKAQLEEANASKDGGKSAAEMQRILDWLNSSVDSDTISFEQLTDAIKGYGTAMDEAKKKTDAIKSAFSDLAEVGQNKIDNPFGALDADNVDKKYQAIRNLYDNTDLFTNDKYAGALNPETGDIDYNSDAFKDMFLDSLDKMIAACKETGGAAGTYLAKGFEDAKNKIKNNVIGIEEFINGIGSTLSNINDRMDNFQSAFNDLSDIVDEYNTYGDLSQDNIQKFMALDPKYTACLELQGNKLVFNKEAFKALYIAELQELATKYEGTEAGKRYADILEKVDNGTWDVTNHMQGMNSEGEKLKTLFSDLSSLLSDFLGIFEKLNDTKSNDLKLWGEAMTEEIDKRIDALNEANDAQERSIELAKLQDEYEKAKANKTVHVYGGRGQGFVWKADDNAVHEAEQNLSDKRREYKLKDETDALNKLKDKYSEAMNLIGTDIDDYNKKLEYAAKIHNMSFEEMSDGVTSYKDSVIASLGAVNTVTDIKNTISNISSLISTLETLANVLNLLGGGSGNGGGIQGLFNQIKNMFTGEGGKFDLGGGFKKMFDGAAKVVSDGWNWITGKNRAGSAALRKDTTATLDILGNTIKVNTGDIQRVSGGFFERLVGSAKDNLGSIGKFFSKAWTSISEKTGLMFGDIGSFFTEGFGLLNSQTGIGLGGIVETVGSMFGPIAAGAQSIGSAISSGVVSFFPSIFAGLGTLVTSVGGAMAAMMQAIAAALASIPVAGWIAAAAAVAGAVALIATIASVASNVSNTQVDEPTPAFQAKKYAKGTRGVKKGQIANVDEKGEELIVRNPDQGRMTYLEKGDGVIPAKETDNLMAIGANPEGWLAKGLAEMTGSAAAGAGMSAKGPNAQLSGAAAAAAAGVGSVFKDEYDEILGDTNEFMSGLSDIFKKSDNPIIAAIQSMFYFVNKTAYRMSTVGKINSSKTVTESTSNTKKAAQSQISSMTSNFESSWKSVAGELGLDTKDIEATSKKMSEKMNELVNNTFDALNENTGLSAEQVEDVTNTMFDSLQKIYTSGWNSLASTSGDMSEEIAKKLNASYKSSVDSTNKAMNEISKAFGHSWNKVGGGVKTLSTNVQKTMEQAWADTSKDTQKLMYDMRACFDNSWSMNEAGVTNLADMTQGVVKDGYAEIDSSSSDTFGENGQLKTDADNSWKNVEPGATNLANNMQWVMDQSYNAIKAGCEAAVTSIKNDLATTGDAFEAVATKAEKAKQETQTTTTPKTETKKETDWSGTAAGAVIGSAFGPFGSLIGAGIGYLIHHASGVKSAKFPHMANVDEQGPEMLVRKPDSGRYTYLETGDGVVPADITSKLFEMGGNPDAWFQKQMAKYGSQPIVQGGGGDVTTSIGDIIITNPVGSSDALANEIKQKLPTKVAQMQSKR